MRVIADDSRVSVWISSTETYWWADDWPCSNLCGRRFFAAFDSNGLVDLEIDGGRGDQDVDQNELYACLSDYLRGHKKLPATHLIWDYL
ncbi:MAG: hypothetical protein ACYC63_04660 [Armatimonadota bacterium]